MLGSNVKFFRVQRGISQDALAQKIGVSKMAISNYENNKRVPDYKTVQQLCKALEVPVGTFMAYRGDTVRVAQCVFRNADRMPKTAQDNVRKQAQWAIDRLFELVSFLGEENEQLPPYTHIQHFSGDRQNLDEVARDLRKNLGFSDNGFVGDLTAYLENRGFILLQIEADERFTGCHCEVHGREFIFTRKGIRADRRRATIVHELVHIFVDTPDDPCDERYVENVAGRFLLPAVDIKRELIAKRRDDLTVYEVAALTEEYGISVGAVFCRAHQEGILSRSFSVAEVNAFESRLSNSFDWHRERSMQEEPTLLQKLACIAYQKDVLGLSKISELLQIPYAQAASLCQ